MGGDSILSSPRAQNGLVRCCFHREARGAEKCSRSNAPALGSSWGSHWKSQGYPHGGVWGSHWPSHRVHPHGGGWGCHWKTQGSDWGSHWKTQGYTLGSGTHTRWGMRGFRIGRQLKRLIQMPQVEAHSKISQFLPHKIITSALASILHFRFVLPFNFYLISFCRSVSIRLLRPHYFSNCAITAPWPCPKRMAFVRRKGLEYGGERW